jgi:hypothetical protein
MALRAQRTLRAPSPAGWRCAVPSVLRERIVRVTVQPSLARLRRCNDRMAGSPSVLGRMPVRRAIATVRSSALLTCSKMDPLRANLHALLAHPVFRVLDDRDRFQMRAGVLRCHPSVSIRDSHFPTSLRPNFFTSLLSKFVGAPSSLKLARAATPPRARPGTTPAAPRDGSRRLPEGHWSHRRRPRPPGGPSRAPL